MSEFWIKKMVSTAPEALSEECQMKDNSAHVPCEKHHTQWGRSYTKWPVKIRKCIFWSQMEIFFTFFPCCGTKTSFSLVRELKSFNLGISPGLGASQAGWVLFVAIVCFCDRLPFLKTVLSLLQGNEILKRGGRGRASFSRSNAVRSNIDWKSTEIDSKSF